MVNKYKTTLKWTPVGRRVAFSWRAAKVTRGWSWRMKSDKRFILEFRPAAWSPSLSFCARSTPLQVPFFTRLNAELPRDPVLPRLVVPRRTENRPKELLVQQCSWQHCS